MSGLGAFDRILDFTEGAIDAITGTGTRAQHTTSAANAPSAGPIELLEAIDSVTGRAIFIVKTPTGDTAETSSRELAETLKRLLEAQ